MNKFRLLPLALLILVFTVTAYADRDAEIRDLKLEKDKLNSEIQKLNRQIASTDSMLKADDSRYKTLQQRYKADVDRRKSEIDSLNAKIPPDQHERFQALQFIHHVLLRFHSEWTACVNYIRCPASFRFFTHEKE